MQLLNKQKNYILKLYTNKKITKALKEAIKLSKRIKNDMFILNIIGVCYKSLGQLQEAILTFQKMLKINPNQSDVHNNLATSLRDYNCLDDSISHYKKALKINPNFAEASNNLAKVLKIKGQFSNAIKYYQNSLSINSNFLDPLSAEVSLLVQLNRLDTDLLLNHILPFTKSQNNIVSMVTLAIGDYINNSLDRATLLLKEVKTLLESADFLTLEQPQQNFTIAYFNFLTYLIDIHTKQTEQNIYDNEIFHIGESHCLTFAHQSIEIDKTPYTIKPKMIFGAKAWHFYGNKENEFQAIFKYHIQNIPKNSKVILSFGEIDCRATEGILPYHLKTKTDISTIIHQTVDKYIKTTQKHLKEKNILAYYMGVPAPIIERNNDLSKLRVKIVKEFNEVLKNTLKKQNLKFIDTYQLTTNEEGSSNLKYMCDEFHLHPLSLEHLVKYF